MAKSIPAYILKEFDQLERALNSVAAHAEKIETWASKQVGECEAMDYFCAEKLDSPYEFNKKSAIHWLEYLLTEEGK